MDDQQIQEIADRVIAALQGLAPDAPSPLADIAAFTPVAALIAAIVAAIVGWRNLKQQQRALKVTVRSDARNLRQRREADARSEWWRRTQWALEAATSGNTIMYGYGTGMLDLLAQSELAGPEDKELLDAVWEGTSTEMRDDGIERLLMLAKEQDGLTVDELASLRSYFNDVDVGPETGENGTNEEDSDG